jgi:hypothetical protein
MVGIADWIPPEHDAGSPFVHRNVSRRGLIRRANVSHRSKRFRSAFSISRFVRSSSDLFGVNSGKPKIHNMADPLADPLTGLNQDSSAVIATVTSFIARLALQPILAGINVVRRAREPRIRGHRFQRYFQ